MMKQTAELLRGTLRVRVRCPYPERALNLCGAHGVDFWGLETAADGALVFTIRRGERERLRRALEPIGAEITLERAAGAPFFLRRFRRRYALVAGLGLLLALVFVNSFFIWDFSLSGNETVPSEKILRVLERQGLRRGSFAYSFRPQDLCNRALPELPELAWLTVNVRGCRAYVTVRERIPKPELADDRTPTNIVARRDALVTEVRAYDGKALVMKGSTVTAGQLLISGAVDTEGPENPSVRSRLLAGRGEVWGRTWYELSAKIPLAETRKVYSEREKREYSLIFGTKRVKFGGKGSSNFGADCDKIISRHRLTLPFGAALPLVWEQTTLRPYTLEHASESRAAAQKRGVELLMDALREQVDGEIVSTRASSAVQGEWLLVTLSAECHERIGRSVPILTD